MGGASDERMHQILFGLKRAFQSSLEWSKKVFAVHGLTPARFDMLYAIGSEETLYQSGLRRMLGVSGATISRMLKALKQLGLVDTFVDEFDRRCKVLVLTERGQEVLDEAIEHVFGGGVGQLAVESVVERWWPNTALVVHRAILTLSQRLACIRRHFGDCAKMRYDTEPGD